MVGAGTGGDAFLEAPDPGPKGASDRTAWRSKVVRADVTEHGPELSSDAIMELRRGRSGTVRSDLVDDHIARVLNSQLAHYSIADLKALVWRNSARPEVAEVAYEAVTQYGALEGLIGMARRIDELCAAPERFLYCPNDTSLGAVVRYLGVNKSILPLDWKIPTTDRIQDGAVVVLDEVVISRLRREPAFRSAMVDCAVTLVCPLGWHRGVTPFSTPDLGAVEARVNSIIAQSAIDPRADRLAIRRAIHVTMAREVSSELEQLDPGLNRRLEFVPGAASPKRSVFERIAVHLNGRSGISPEALTARIEEFDAGLRPAVRELIVRYASVFSHRTLAQAAREHATAIDSLALERDVKPENVCFCCPMGRKSFGMYGLIFRQANPHYSVDMFIRFDELAAWVSERKNASRLVVVLDDLAVTGETYKKVAPLMLLEVPQLEAHELVISPLVATESAIRALDAGKTTAGCRIHRARAVPRIIDGELYRGASESTRVTLRAALGSLGFQESGVMLALPYMAPDNNVELFATCFAEFFTLRESAVRGRGEGHRRFAARRHGDPASIVERQAQEYLKGARTIATVVASLENLGKSLDETRLFWDHLPTSVQKVLADDWAKTVKLFERERDGAVMVQVRNLRRMIAANHAEPAGWFRARVEYEVLTRLAAQTALSVTSREAIRDLGVMLRDMKGAPGTPFSKA